jgi:heme-degrading monooxygenase HmoA
MIARFWSAQTTGAQAPGYVDHLKNQVLPTLKKVDGYAGGLLLEREVSDGVEIIVITFWQSLDSIRGFAGNNLEEAVVADEAASLLTQFDRHVRHYELVVKDEVQWDLDMLWKISPGPSLLKRGSSFKKG